MRGRGREVEFGPVNGVYRSAEPEPAEEGMVEPLPAPTGLRTTVHIYTAQGRTRTLVGPALGRYVDVWL